MVTRTRNDLRDSLHRYFLPSNLPSNHGVRTNHNTVESGDGSLKVIYSKWTSSSRRDGLIYFCKTTERLLSSPSPPDDSHWSYRDVANRLVVGSLKRSDRVWAHPHRHNDSRYPWYLVEEYKRSFVALASPSNFWNFCFMNSFFFFFEFEVYCPLFTQQDIAVLQEHY